MLQFVEFDDGRTIGGLHACAICQYAYSIFEMLCVHACVLKTLGKVLVEAKEFYYAEMEGRYPELGLCEYH